MSGAGHGTPSGLRQHESRGEHPCPSCRWVRSLDPKPTELEPVREALATEQWAALNRLDALRDAEARIGAMTTHMHERHKPRVAEVYSAHHHEADHETEDERCDPVLCFESMSLCQSCGSSFPCLEIRAFDAATASGVSA